MGVSEFKKMQARAVEIREKYDKVNPKKWEAEQVLMGMVKDVGDLSKILMVVNNYRDDLPEDAEKALGHELADILWSVMIIANKTGTDLEQCFFNTMDELDKRLK